MYRSSLFPRNYPPSTTNTSTPPDPILIRSTADRTADGATRPTRCSTSFSTAISLAPYRSQAGICQWRNSSTTAPCRYTRKYEPYLFTSWTLSTRRIRCFGTGQPITRTRSTNRGIGELWYSTTCSCRRDVWSKTRTACAVLGGTEAPTAIWLGLRRVRIRRLQSFDPAHSASNSIHVKLPPATATVTTP